MQLLVVVLALSLVDVILSAGCNSKVPIRGKPNNFPILDLTKPNPNMVLLGQIKNAKAYLVTVPNSGGNTVSNYTVTHVWGNYYEMGYAQGAILMKHGPSSIKHFIDSVWEYFEEQVEGALPNFFPAWFAKIIADFGLEIALDVTASITYPWTDQRIFDELQGLADSTGLQYRKLLRVHMIAGLTQGKCSMFGMWGDALASGDARGHVLQLRALDWDMKGPFRNYASITVYHPNDGTNAHLLIGMAGFIGGLTGVSDKQLGISEIGVSYPDASFGAESRFGIPFIFLLRDILRFDVTVDDSISRMANAKRTCDLILGVGDGKLGEFRGFAYGSETFKVMDDQNMLPDAPTWHPRIKHVVYWGMDWVCPAYNTVLSEQIKMHYGSITPEIAIQNITAIEMSGDNHLAFYDLTEMTFWASFAAAKTVGGPVAAYDRQFVKYNAWDLFNEKQPNL